jgi:hypothetical protein
MKSMFRRHIPHAVIIIIVFVCCAVVVVSKGQPENEKPGPSAKSDKLISLQFETPIPVTVESDGIEWKGYSYHLVRLGSIRFGIDKNNEHLTAEIQAGITSFDDIDYDISAAVFNATGQMLGVARTQCHVDRLWLGNVLTTSQTIALDFGRSLNYANASAFMLTVSKRKVLTPNEWQK